MDGVKPGCVFVVVINLLLLLLNRPILAERLDWLSFLLLVLVLALVLVLGPLVLLLLVLLLLWLLVYLYLW